jgi:hypothetical protein
MVLTNTNTRVTIIHPNLTLTQSIGPNQNDVELTCDMDALKLEDPTCNNWDKYICRKLGSQLPAFYRQLHDAQDSNLKRSLKHTKQAKKCLDCLGYLAKSKV